LWQIPGVPEFRYAQYGPLARAAEVVGERWTRLVVRELLLGPKRFSDLKRALPLFALAAGRLDPAAALRDSEITADGDIAALADYSELFDMAPDPSEPHNP
jgi:hypothetical protein